MSKVVTIPTCQNPFVIILNKKVYSYPAGETLEVPKEVAEIIERHDLSHWKPEYIEDNNDNSAKYIEAQHEIVDLPNATAIKPYAFYIDAIIRRINAPKVTTIGKYAFNGCEKFSMTTLPDTIESIGIYGFKACGSMVLEKLPSSLRVLEEAAFYSCNKMTWSEIPSKVESIGKNAFYKCTKLAAGLTFKGKPQEIDSTAFSGCSQITTINVPWAEGEVANAPWGATNATIHYNHTEG